MSDSIQRLAPGIAPLVLNPLIRLRWRQLGDEWLVFEVLSGQTHRMDLVTAAALNCFESGDALDLAALQARMALDFGLDVDELPARSALAAALNQFMSLGLVMPAPLVSKLHAAV